MLLSEAMRRGAMLGPQCKVLLVSRSGGSCAFGSAALALGVTLKNGLDYDGLFSVFPSLRGNMKLKKAVWLRNDTLGWTREQIADWLVKSGKDCESVTAAPAEQIAAALVSEMVAK
jgi:hypothetical protein